MPHLELAPMEPHVFQNLLHPAAVSPRHTEGHLRAQFHVHRQPSVTSASSPDHEGRRARPRALIPSGRGGACHAPESSPARSGAGWFGAAQTPPVGTSLRRASSFWLTVPSAHAGPRCRGGISTPHTATSLRPSRARRSASYGRACSCSHAWRVATAPRGVHSARLGPQPHHVASHVCSHNTHAHSAEADVARVSRQQSVASGMWR